MTVFSRLFKSIHSVSSSSSTAPTSSRASIEDLGKKAGEDESIEAPVMWMDQGHHVLVQTEFGPMILNRFDTGVSANLAVSGTFEPFVNDVLRACASALPENAVALDIGANFGVTVFAMAQGLSPKATIHAFEPQRVIFQALNGNVALRSLLNVHCHQLGVGNTTSTIKIPMPAYSEFANFGGFELSGNIDGKSVLPPQSGGNGSNARFEDVQVIELDTFGLSRVDLVKIDAEGMENRILEGARELFRRWTPIVFLETLKSDEAEIKTFFPLDKYTSERYAYNTLYIPHHIRDSLQLPALSTHHRTNPSSAL
jgi:FkbM family methyltransferase